MKKGSFNFVLISIMSLFVLACDNDEKPLEKPKIVHENSVEYYVESSRMADGKVLIKTSQQIYVQWKLFKTIVKYDTLPALGTEKVMLQETDKDTVIAKEYDVYFTLK